ncbi:MAG: phosphatase PAP2 family protein [Haloarculaceae archaeon]
MSHGLAATGPALAVLPEPVVAVFVLVTQLGDTWLLFVVLTALYLLGDRVPVVGRGVDRRDAAFLIALGLAAAALTAILKGAFHHPRPAGYDVATAPALVPVALRPLYVSAATASGYSFPSGHAVGSTAVYGALALVGEERRRRLLGAAVVVALVALSRVVIGVHFPVDVVAGVAIGAGLLAVAWWLARDAPGRAFLLVAVLALIELAVRGFTFDALVVLGAAVGARVTWGSLGGAVPDRPGREARLLAAVGLPVVVVLFGLTYAADALVPGAFAAPVVGFVGAGITLGVLVALPAVAGRDERTA